MCVCVCGLLNSEIVTTVIIGCNNTVFFLCSSDFSSVILGIALYIHSVQVGMTAILSTSWPKNLQLCVAEGSK